MRRREALVRATGAEPKHQAAAGQTGSAQEVTPGVAAIVSSHAQGAPPLMRPVAIWTAQTMRLYVAQRHGWPASAWRRSCSEGDACFCSSRAGSMIWPAGNICTAALSFDQRLLQRVQALSSAQAFHGHDASADHRRHFRQTRARGPAVHQHGAAATLRNAAAEPGARQPRSSRNAKCSEAWSSTARLMSRPLTCEVTVVLFVHLLSTLEPQSIRAEREGVSDLERALA